MILFFFYSFFGIFVIFLNIQNQNQNPTSLLYITSLFKMDTDIPFFVTILSHITTMHQTITVLFVTCLFENLVVGFAIFVQYELAVLADNREAQNNGSNNRVKSTIFEFNMNRYEDLNNLMNQFNECFGYLYLLIKIFALFNIYFYVFCVLRYKNYPGLFVYFYIAVIHAGRVLYLLPFLAAAYTESVQFKNSWSKSLKHLTDLQKNQMASIQPLGVKVGNLYVIIPSTVLTFFSVMTTHIIVLLQVFDEK